MVFLTLLFLVLAGNDFSNFTYCHENTRGPFELQCVRLDPNAKGEVTFKRRDDETVKLGVQLSASARDRFITVLAAINYLESGETYESRRKVADLGRKRLTLETPEGTREATYNFSDLKPVMDLTAFFEALINQQTIIFDLENATQFERLSVPKRLDQIETELKSNRIGDPEGLIPLLEKIEADQRLVNYARVQAGKLKKQIEARK